MRQSRYKKCFSNLAIIMPRLRQKRNIFMHLFKSRLKNLLKNDDEHNKICLKNDAESAIRVCNLVTLMGELNQPIGRLETLETRTGIERGYDRHSPCSLLNWRQPYRRGSAHVNPLRGHICRLRIRRWRALIRTRQIWMLCEVLNTLLPERRVSPFAQLRTIFSCAADEHGLRTVLVRGLFIQRLGGTRRRIVPRIRALHVA